MESLNTLIWFMLSCALIPGFMVLYSVGQMNLSAREFEYMFMGIMGYPLISIMKAHIKETVLQLVPALPAGFILGNIILQAVKAPFSNENFVMSFEIYAQSYIYAGIMVIFIAVLIAAYSAWHIDRLDIVEGL